MKKIIITAISLLLFGMLLAETSSFRNQASAGAIDDDLDLIYDPINLHFVSGSRLYTNLSNIVNGQEEFLDNNSNDIFLLGYSLENPFLKNLKHSILIEFTDHQDADNVLLDTDLNGSPDYYAFGEIENIYTSHQDITGDGIYDIIASNTQSTSNYETTNSLKLVINNNYLWNNLICGLRFDIFKNNLDYRETYDLQQTEFDLAEAYYTFDKLQDDDDESDIDLFAFGMDAAAMNPDFRGYELRGDLIIRYMTEENENEERNFGITKIYEPDIVSYLDEEENDDLLKWNENKDGVLIGLNGMLRKTLQEAAERKNDTYWLMGLKLAYGMYKEEYEAKEIMQTREEYFDGADTLSTDFLQQITNIEEMTKSGDNSYLNYELFSRCNYQLDEDIIIGLGATFGYTFDKTEFEVVEEIDNTENYLQNDQIDDENDYIINENFLVKSDETEEMGTTYLSLPVGLEYKFTKNNKWSTRLGANYSYFHNIENGSKQITYAAPVITTTEYGDGTSNVDMENNTYNSTSTQQITTGSYTNYYYGIGFEPSAKMQIDFAGMFDSDYSTLQDFIQSLRMSFTFKF